MHAVPISNFKFIFILLLHTIFLVGFDKRPPILAAPCLHDAYEKSGPSRIIETCASTSADALCSILRNTRADTGRNFQRVAAAPTMANRAHKQSTLTVLHPYWERAIIPSSDNRGADPCIFREKVFLSFCWSVS